MSIALSIYLGLTGFLVYPIDSRGSLGKCAHFRPKNLCSSKFFIVLESFEEVLTKVEDIVELVEWVLFWEEFSIRI